MKKTRILSLLLIVAMLLSLALTGCGSSNEPSNADVADTSNEAGNNDVSEVADGEEVEQIDLSSLSYDELSEYLYMDNLGEFYEAYMNAKNEVESIDVRYALMAIAEAKLLEAGAMLPTTSQGGYYGLTRVAPRSSTTTKWGTDNERYHSRILCNEIIEADDIQALRNLWNELKGTGTYLDQAKAYLTENGYTLKDTYTFFYVSDPQTWDVLNTCLANDSQALVNTYDGLMEYDAENVLQPALAESYEVSDDGLTYTFHLRQGVKWVDYQGREVAEVVADDWVAGMQHLLDAKGGLETLLDGIILNAAEYTSGEITDFSLVGVEAVDDYTVVYTLAAPTPFFLTMLGYNPFAPLCRTYYLSQGGGFGLDYETVGSGTYGSSPNNIVYNGPYLITNWTANNIMVFSYNDTYYNPDVVNVHTITWLYNDGSDATRAYTEVLSGNIDGTTLNTSTLELAQNDGNFDKYVYITETDACSFVHFLNMNRGTYANYNDATNCVSPKADNEEEQARTSAAMKNVHFRRALVTSLERIGWNAQAVGDALAAVSLRNSYTPGDFVYLETDVTVDINGTPTTFPAGTYYGEMLQAQLDADGFPVKVWDPETLSGDSFDGWFNVEYATSELALAVEELAAQGITVDADHPIQIDIVYPANVVTYTNKAMAYKQNIEANSNGLIVINAIAGNDYQDWYDATYFPGTGAEMNNDVNDCTGWIPDYGDPSSYLDTILPYYAGYMTKCLGMY